MSCIEESESAPMLRPLRSPKATPLSSTPKQCLLRNCYKVAFRSHRSRSNIVDNEAIWGLNSWYKPTVIAGEREIKLQHWWYATLHSWHRTVALLGTVLDGMTVQGGALQACQPATAVTVHWGRLIPWNVGMRVWCKMTAVMVLEWQNFQTAAGKPSLPQHDTGN